MHMAIINCPLRVVVNIQYSAIGYGYPRIFVEATFNERYINIDCALEAAFVMKASDFEDWFSDAQPKTLQDACTEAGLDEQVFRALLKELRPDLDFSKEVNHGIN